MAKSFRFAMRTLLKSPFFTLTASLTLAIGIGANVALFSVYNAVLLSPFPYHEPDRLVFLYGTNPKSGVEQVRLSYPELVDLRERTSHFTDIAAYSRAQYNLTGGSEPRRVFGELVTPNFFSVLGVPPIMGRDFQSAADGENPGQVVLLNESLWRETFGADEGILGKPLDVNGQPYTIIGIMPGKAELFKAADIWLPVSPEDRSRPREDRFMTALARLDDGASLESAKTQVSAIGTSLEQEYPDVNRDLQMTADTLRGAWFGDAQALMTILLVMIGFVLLIACANVTNLVITRMMNREKDMAIHLAMGASSRNLVWQSFAESILLVGLASGVGMVLGFWGGKFLAASIPVDLPAWFSFEIDGRGVLYTLLIAALTTLILGLTAAFRLPNFKLNECLKDAGSGRATAGAKGQRLRRLLVSFELAVSLVLLVATGLMVKSFVHVLDVDPGFETGNRLSLVMDLPEFKYGEDFEKVAFVGDVLHQIESNPGIDMATAVSFRVPMRGSRPSRNFTLEKEQVLDPSRETPFAVYHSVTTRYFETMGIELVQGRTFHTGDTSDSQQVAVVDREFVRRFFPDGTAVGQRLRFDSSGSPGEWMSIAGVVGNVRHEGLEDEYQPTIYVPFAQIPSHRMSLVVVTHSDPKTLIAPIRREIATIDPTQPLSEFMTMDEVIHEYLWQWRFFSSLFWVATGIALVLALIGIYGVMAYSVSRQSREIGLRMALGAQKTHILRLVGRSGLKIVLGGLLVGLPVAWGAVYVLRGVLFEVGDSGVGILLVMASVLVVISALAILLPSLRAIGINPMLALRQD